MQRLAKFLFFILLLFALSPLTVLASTNVVNTTNDENGTGTACSLREAIISANNDANYGGCVGSGSYGGIDIIDFSTSVFNTPQAITLTTDLPSVIGKTWITGPGASLLTIDGQGLYRAFHIDSNVSAIPNTFTVEISDLTLIHGKNESGGSVFVEVGALKIEDSVFTDHDVTGAAGGVIRNDDRLTIYRSSFNNNSADDGGAIFNQGELRISGSTFDTNTATNRGGAIYTNEYVIAVVGSLFVDNSAAYGGAFAGGGGITNSTFTGNSATNNGGVIYNNTAFSMVRIFNSTLNGNSATTIGGVYTGTDGWLSMANNIVANNTGGDCYNNGEIFVMSNNIVEDGSCGATGGFNGNKNVDPLLDPAGLQNNGGLTLTIAISPASAAVNAGNNTYRGETHMSIDYNFDGDKLDSLATDQRGTGYPRTNNSTVDMGAFETSYTGLIVDTSSDASLFSCTNAANDCSLRGAITVANSLTGANTISFDSTVFATEQTISLNSDLPDITETLTITGPGVDFLTITGNENYRPFYIDNSANLTLSGLFVSDASVSGDGGAIYLNSGSLSINSLLLSSNDASGSGGALYINSGSSTVVNNSYFGFNAATGNGGAIYNNGSLRVNDSYFVSNLAGSGGAIYNNNMAEAVIVGGSSFTSSLADYGGAIFGRAMVFNSSFGEGLATNQGGTFYLNNAAHLLTLINVTIVENSSSAGGGIYLGDGTIQVLNTIVASNTGGDCVLNAGTANISHSLIEDGSCGISNGVNGNLIADPLIWNGIGDNGGSTLTALLPPVSPAANSGNNSYLSEATANVDFNGDGDLLDSLDTDQRGSGFNRLNNSTVDMGAYESTGTFTGLVVDTDTNLVQTECTSAPSDCTLQGVIFLANGIAGADTITFDSSLFASPQIISFSEDTDAITDDLTISGPGTNLLTISLQTGLRAFAISGATVNLSGMSISNADYNAPGGAIYLDTGNLNINNVSFSSNATSADGGAIYAESGTSLSINNSSFSDNSSATNGGAIFSDGNVFIMNSSFSNNSANHGGAVYSETNANITVGGSSFSGNDATNSGGALHGEFQVFNSSFYANTANVAGAISTEGSSTLLHVTMSSNSAVGMATGGLVINDGTLSVMNSIIGSNTGGDCNNDGSPIIVSYSLIEDAGCGISNGIDGNLTGEPYVTPFANYGGTISMLGLLPFSPGINAGNNAYLSEAGVNIDFNNDGDTFDSLNTDQRGTSFNRTINTTVDMGAFEANPSTTVSGVAPIRNYHTTNTPTLSWGRVSWATGYELQISNSTSFGTLLCGGTISITASTQSYTTCQLAAGTYYWRVRGTSSTGVGTWSAVDVFVIGGP